MAELGFNSSLVRLEEIVQKRRAKTSAMFQFQLGSIRSGGEVRVTQASHEFQFQLGSIRSRFNGLPVRGGRGRFNSSLVRLEGPAR